jgi:hypothetical protein
MEKWNGTRISSNAEIISKLANVRMRIVSRKIAQSFPRPVALSDCRRDKTVHALSR